MEKSGKQVIYWICVVFYGVALLCALLFLRFPADKFRSFCERKVEQAIPQVTCSIGKISMGFPMVLTLNNVKLQSKAGGAQTLFDDPSLKLSPNWKRPLQSFSLESTAFGGLHLADVSFSKDGKSVRLNNLQITNLQIDKMENLKTKLDRTISGKMGITGRAVIDTNRLVISEAEGTMYVEDGELELKKPILEQNVLGLEESSVNFKLSKDTVSLAEGRVKGNKLTLEYAGNIQISGTLLDGKMNLKGGLVPLELLYRDKRQLKPIVTRMQKKYRKSALPFTVGGTVVRPTFAFGK